MLAPADDVGITSMLTLQALRHVRTLIHLLLACGLIQHPVQDEGLGLLMSDIDQHLAGAHDAQAGVVASCASMEQSWQGRSKTLA